VKSGEFSKDPDLEIGEISVSKSDAYGCPQSIVDALDEAVGNTFNEVVEDLVLPVLQCGKETCQVFIACGFGLSNPCMEKSGSLFSACDLFEDRSDIRVQSSPLWATDRRHDLPDGLGRPNNLFQQTAKNRGR